MGVFLDKRSGSKTTTDRRIWHETFLEEFVDTMILKSLGILNWSPHVSVGVILA